MTKYLKYSLIALIVILFITAFSGCGGGAEKSAKLSHLDSLQTALNQLESGLKEIDREQVKSSYLSCKENLQKIYVVFQNNPLSVQEEFLIQYEKLKVNLNRLVLDIDNAEKEIQFGIQQVEIWKSSVKQGDFKEEELTQYCNSENEAIRSLSLILSNKTKEWSNMQLQINTFEPEVKRLTNKK